MNPKVSIVMPMYGVEAYIAKAIESVLNQTFQDWELLIVNDGSKDRSREIASEYKKKDSRIRILDKENGGLSDARNFGLREAKGEYIHFFDSDDWIEPDFYEVMSKIADEKGKNVLIGGFFIDTFHDYNHGIIERKCSNSFSEGIKSLGKIDFVSFFISYAWNKLFRRDFLIQNVLEYEYGLYRIEDIEFMSRVMSISTDFAYCSYSGYHYRCVTNSITLSKMYDEKLLEHTYKSFMIWMFVFQTFFGYDNYISNALAMKAYRGIFCGLNDMDDKSHKITIIKTMLGWDEIRKNINPIYAKDFKSLILSICFRLKMTKIIFAFYN